VSGFGVVLDGEGEEGGALWGGELEDGFVGGGGEASAT
jgi:hypothetical protein